MHPARTASTGPLDAWALGLRLCPDLDHPDPSESAVVAVPDSVVVSGPERKNTGPGSSWDSQHRDARQRWQHGRHQASQCAKVGTGPSTGISSVGARFEAARANIGRWQQAGLLRLRPTARHGWVTHAGPALPPMQKLPAMRDPHGIVTARCLCGGINDYKLAPRAVTVVPIQPSAAAVSVR
jgi:hypothetical protein